MAQSGSDIAEAVSVGDIVTYSYLYKRKHSVGITSFIRPPGRAMCPASLQDNLKDMDPMPGDQLCPSSLLALACTTRTLTSRPEQEIGPKPEPEE